MRPMLGARWLVPLLCALAACGAGAAPTSAEALPPVLLVIAPAPSTQPASSAWSEPRTSSKELAPDWSGTWVGERGYEFTFQLHVDRKGPDSSEVEGWFEYRLTKAPGESRFREQLGRVGREYVRGRYEPSTRSLTLRGYRTDAPAFLTLDEYRLEIGATGRSLSGRARGNSYLWDCTLRGRVTRR